MKLRLCLFIIICSALSTSFCHADATALLSEQLQGTHTLQANFVQTIRNEKGELLQQAKGELKVKNPNQLHWLTLDPYEHLVVTNGETLWLYDVDLEQISRESYSNNIDRAPALLLSGDVKAISDNYDVSQLSSTDGVMQFKLTPHNDESVFSELLITFTEHAITRMTLKDNFDQTTVIEFSDVVINNTIDDSLFNFIAPDGIEVFSNDS